MIQITFNMNFNKKKNWNLNLHQNPSPLYPQVIILYNLIIMFRNQIRLRKYILWFGCLATGGNYTVRQNWTLWRPRAVWCPGQEWNRRPRCSCHRLAGTWSEGPLFLLTLCSSTRRRSCSDTALPLQTTAQYRAKFYTFIRGSRIFKIKTKYFRTVHFETFLWHIDTHHPNISKKLFALHHVSASLQYVKLPH